MWTSSSSSSVGAPALASTHGVELRLIDSCHITQKSRRVSALQGHEFNFFPAGSSGFPTQFGPFKEGRWAFKYFFLTAPERNYLLGVDNCCRLRLGKGGEKKNKKNCCIDFTLVANFKFLWKRSVFLLTFRLTHSSWQGRRDGIPVAGRWPLTHSVFPWVFLGRCAHTWARRTQRAITYANLIKRAINHTKCTNYSFVAAWLAAALQAGISWVMLEFIVTRDHLPLALTNGSPVSVLPVIRWLWYVNYTLAKVCQGNMVAETLRVVSYDRYIIELLIKIIVIIYMTAKMCN